MTTKNLNPIQKKLLNLLIKNTDDPLTIREMQDKLGLSSTSVVAYHIERLIKNGYLKKNPYNPRDFQVLKDAPEKQIAYLNLYGMAYCGPTGSLLDGNPIDRVPISIKWLTFPSSEGFLVKAKGDSMTPKINEGDFVIARRTDTAENGTIVVCVNNGDAIIKKIQFDEEKTILTSLNQSYAPFLASDDFKIEGEVRGVISYKIK